MAISLFESGFRARDDIHREAITIAEALAMTISALRAGMTGDAAAGAVVWAIGIVRSAELVRALEHVGADVTGRPVEVFRDLVSRGAIRPFETRLFERRAEGTPGAKGSGERPQERKVGRAVGRPEHRERHR